MDGAWLNGLRSFDGVTLSVSKGLDDTVNYTPRASMAAWYFLRRNLVLSSRRS